MDKIVLTPNMVAEIVRILERGNTAEIKARKDDVIVLEVKRRIMATSKVNN